MQSYLKTRPAWLQILIFLGMAFGIFIALSLVGSLILSRITGVSLLRFADVKNWTGNNPGMIGFMRGMILVQFLGLFVIPSLLFAYYSDPQPLQYLGLNRLPKPVYWVLGIAVLLAAIPLVEYTGILNRGFNFGEGPRKWMQSLEDQAARQIQFMLRKRTLSYLVTNVIFIALFAGIGEELFFRGVLQRIFIKAFKNPWAGIIITAVIFSAFHFQFFGFIPRLLLGVLLGAVYWYSGSLWPAIIAHFVYDGFFIVLAYFQPQMIENTEATVFNPSGMAITAGVSTVLVIVLLWFMKKASTTTYQKVYADEGPKREEEEISF